MLHVTAITAKIRQDIYKNVSETVNIVDKEVLPLKSVIILVLYCPR